MSVLPVPSDSPAELTAVGQIGRPLVAREIWLTTLAGCTLFVLALGLRLWGHALGSTADDQDWVRRAVDFAQAVQKRELRATYQSAHPGVPVLWIATMIVPPEYIADLESRDDDRTRLEKSSAYLPVLYRVRQALAGYAAALTVAIAFLTARLFGWHVGLLAGLLVAAEPFLVAHAQIFSTDSLLAMLMSVSLLAALVYLDGKGDRFYLAVSGLTAGLAFSTKAPAIMLFGLIPLIVVLWAIVGHRPAAEAPMTSGRRWRLPRASLRPLVWDLLLWGGVAVLTYVLIWPALWVDPVTTLTRLERGVRGIGESPRRWGNFFLGRTYDSDDVALWLWPVFYPLVTSLRLSPLTFVGLLTLAGAAVYGLVRARIRPQTLTWTPDRRVIALAGYVLLFTVMMTLSPKKLDRYLLPAFPILVVLAALGLWLAVRRLLPGRWHWPAVAVLGACQIAMVASVAPYPLSFYNPLLGGAVVARQAMIVGWGEGLDQVADYLNQQPDARQIVAVSLYKDQIVPLFRGNGARVEDWQRGNVLVMYVNMEQRGLVPAPLQELVATTSPDHTVWINGIAYARIYRIPAEIRERAGREAGPRPNSVPHP